MNSEGDDITRGFVNVNDMDDPQSFVEFLDKRKSIQGEREVKEPTLGLLDLRPGLNVLDVGCGTGDDTREMASLVGSSGRERRQTIEGKRLRAQEVTPVGGPTSQRELDDCKGKMAAGAGAP